MADHHDHHLPSSNSSINPYERLNIIYNADNDTLTRLISIPSITNPPPFSPQLGLSIKDFPLNATNKTWLRLFRPAATPPPPNSKLPLIIYFHGGGFILCSAANTLFHDHCARLASDLPAVVATVEYRLAPESRLPAAYDDAMDAINWVREQALHADEWLRDSADFSRCYLMGSSAGGNIAYHAGLRSLAVDLEPVKIVGLILDKPYFGGAKRSGSELRLENDSHFPLVVNHMMWELSLPEGADRDHEYCNPTVGSSGRERIARVGRCFISVGGGDPMMDRQMELGKMMEEKGVEVKIWFEKEGFHGQEMFEPPWIDIMLAHLKLFIYSRESAYA